MATSHDTTAADGQMNINTGSGTVKSVLQNGGQGNNIYTAETMHFNRHREEPSYREIAAWCSPADAMSSHVSAQTLHQADTGAWLCNSEQYKAWLNNKHSHFWLNGSPGGGKTVLCSMVIEDLSQRCKAVEGSALAFFYFSFSDVAKQSYSNMLRSIVSQFAETNDYVLSELRQAYYRRKLPEIYELENILQSSHVSKQLYVVLDALDECPEERESRTCMLDGVLSLAQHNTKIKLFMTSRRLTDIRQAMVQCSAIETSIATVDACDDISRYLTAQLAKDRKLARFSSQIKTDIKNTIAARADGMFRFAHLQLQEVKRLDSLRPSYIKNALNCMPETLDETYARCLRKIKPEYHDDAVKLLRWIAYAARPLSLLELRECVLIDLAVETVHVNDRGDLEDPLRLLAGLVVTFREDDYQYGYNDYSHGGSLLTESNNESDEEEGEEAIDRDMFPGESDDESRSSGHSFNARATTLVRLAHFTVKEYLESNRAKEQVAAFHLEKSISQHFLTKSCVQYIIFYGDRHTVDFKWLEPDAQWFHRAAHWVDDGTFPLMKYASMSWHYHARLHDDADISSEVAVISSTLYRQHWLSVDHRLGKSPFTFPPQAPTPTYELYFAAMAGLEKVVAKVLKAGSDVNQIYNVIYTLLSPKSMSALSVASQFGQIEVVRMLLDAGADVNKFEGSEQTALAVALAEGHTAIAQLLISRGAGVKANEIRYATLHAVSRRTPGILRVLLKHATQLDPVEFVWILARAAEHSPEMLECLLFENVLWETIVKKLYDIALCMMALQGRTALVRRLLDSGANKETCEHMDCALFSASFVGHSEIVRMLLHHGVAASAAENLHGSLRQPLFMQDYEQLGRASLEHSTNVNTSVNDYHGGALQAASASGNLETMKLLLDHGADVNATGGPNDSALFAAATQNFETFFDSVDDESSYLNIPLRDLRAKARSESYLKAVELLLDYGANINVLRRGCESVLYAASAMNDLDLARLLIARHADLEIGTGEFGTAVCAAAWQGHIRMVKLLAQAGAALNANGLYGSAFYAAIKSGNVKMINVMQEYGADVNANVGGETSLSFALRTEDIDMVKLLLQYGADVNALSESEQHALSVVLSVAEDTNDDDIRVISSSSSTDDEHQDLNSLRQPLAKHLRSY